MNKLGLENGYYLANDNSAIIELKNDQWRWIKTTADIHFFDTKDWFTLCDGNALGLTNCWKLLTNNELFLEML